MERKQMKRIISYIALTVISAVASAQQATESIQDRVETLVSDPTFSQSVVGICARTVGGEEIVDINSDIMMLPASNMKLISTGAALHTLGPEWQFETHIGYDGTIEDGTLKGNLYIIGGGDPTIGSKDSIAVALDRTFAQWEAIIRASGITKVEGHLIGDGRWFEGMAEEPTWLMEDAGTYYGAGTTGLMFYENMQSFSVSAGPEVGSPVNISPYYPEAPWMEFRYNCSTGREGTGDMLYMYASDLVPVAEIRGTFGVDRAAKRLDCANKFPEYTCAYYFYNYLKSKGIDCAGGPADVERFYRGDENKFYNGSVGDSPESHLSDVAVASQRAGADGPSDLPPALSSLSILGSTFSPTLDRIAFETNHDSNNLYAETLFRTLGKELHDSACYDSSYVAMDDVLKALGVSSDGASIQDGSGLSRQNYVNADFFCRFLEAMTASPAYGSYLRSLPSPGGKGTLQYNMKGQPAELRNRIKVKSGSMNGVRCYSGYILPSDCQVQTLSADPAAAYEALPEEIKSRTIVFSIMTNNCTSPTWKVRPLLDKVMVTLASAN